MSLPAVAWGISVAGWIMSPIISKLLDKLLSHCKSNKEETLCHLLTDVLPRLTLTLEAAEAINHSKLFEDMVRGLKSAFYDMEDILDELEYIRHQKMLDAQNNSKSKKKKKRLKITSDDEAGSSNQDICIEPSSALTGPLNARLKDSMAKIEDLITKARGIITLAESPSKGKTVTAKNMHTRTTSAPVELVTGRDEDRDRITRMLRDTEDVNSRSNNNKCFSVIGIYGISGSGKTTLAQYVCNVGDIFKEMYEAASVDKKKACPEYNSLDVLEKELEKKLKDKRFLLVLDDIWCNKDVGQQQLPKLLSPMKAGKRGSKILATSRNKDAFSDLGPGVACNVFPIRDLDDQAFLELFMYYALGSTNPDDSGEMELRSIGAEISQKLKRSPLAARTVGGQLRKKQSNVEFWKITRDRDLLDETIGALLWSYQQLDEQIRRCFSYIIIFPRRHSLDRNELVKLWVAEGFIQTANPEEDPEVVGQCYFDELLATSFMQPGESKWGDPCYLVHDLMYDLAEKVAGNDCFRIENGQRRQVPRDVRHLFVAKGQMATKEIFELKNLRTLIIHDTKSANDVFLQKVFKKLLKLRVLVVDYEYENRGNGTIKIPESIGRLKHLRHLSLIVPTNSKLILPGTLTNLYHLQALILKCYDELEFPSDIDMSKLSNLRHISMSNFGKTLPNIARLTSLQTLERFEIRIEHGHEIKQMRDLNKLQGNLLIRDLGNVKSKNEAQEANLAAKTRLTGLELVWFDGTTSPEVEAEVLEGLCPPGGLKSLAISGYKGLGYPSWMMGVQNGGPEYLNTLLLDKCYQLGPAPKLFDCFIHLRELIIWDCCWDYLPDNVKDLRCLKTIWFSSCPNIKSLPELPLSLEDFKTSRCDRGFTESCQQVDHPNWQKLQHVKKCRFIP
ncbi:putative disease resistance RPP13-like protein 1 [Lolium rigidum]|uniref:putative disease resistance RPP13-like protein 1 n=1 Tax=Lolium rigidum TaxID=89674 RepID=UPI001F5E0A48|nr:putative disease resistance RPP13-like protein 1 [Lolium rigidum]